MVSPPVVIGSRIRKQPAIAQRPRCRTAHAVHASLFARATMNTFGCARVSRFVSQQPKRCDRWR
jgi:hypothetical protein